MFDLAFIGAVATLTLNRPAARNAIPAAGWRELGKVVERAAAQEPRLLILRGAGTAFCAGADLADFETMHQDAAARSAFRKEMRQAIEAVADAPFVTVALVHGPCYGAGVALAMACDVRFAGPDASFAITPAKFGISYPQDDVHRLVSLVGMGQAGRMLLGAGPIDGREAARIGLAERFVPAGLDEEVSAFAAAVAANDPASLRTLKRGIALAARGVASDEAQDRLFDDLIGSAGFARRLVARRAR